MTGESVSNRLVSIVQNCPVISVISLSSTGIKYLDGDPGQSYGYHHPPLLAVRTPHILPLKSPFSLKFPLYNEPTCLNILMWVKPSTIPQSPFLVVSPSRNGYGSIPIHTIFRGMNIHLPAILMFTRGIGFWPIPKWAFHVFPPTPSPPWRQVYPEWRPLSLEQLKSLASAQLRRRAASIDFDAVGGALAQSENTKGTASRRGGNRRLTGDEPTRIAI